tara:strand:+ start:106 stop:813 length:708 start_codon:yes stop_codon:yes gene_type:complete
LASRKVNESQKKEILDLFKNGNKIKDISEIFNFTVPTITRQLKNLLGNEEFIKIKNSKFENQNSISKEFKNNKTRNLIEKNEFKEKNNLSVSINERRDIKNDKSWQEENESNIDSFFVELAPFEYTIENSKQKDLSSISLSDIEFPKVVFMIVDQKIELQIKLLKEYPEWQFLSQEDLNRKTIKIYFDLKSAKSDCNKDQKVIKVPNTNVFKIVTPILLSRGISRIVSSDQLIAL